MRFHGRRNAAGNLVLDREYFARVAVIPLSPLVNSGRGIDELRTDAHPLIRPANAALEYVADAELAGDLLHVNGPIFVGKCRISRDHEKPPNAGQLRDEVLRNAVREMPFVASRANVREWQHHE